MVVLAGDDDAAAGKAFVGWVRKAGKSLCDSCDAQSAAKAAMVTAALAAEESGESSFERGQVAHVWMLSAWTVTKVTVRR